MTTNPLLNMSPDELLSTTRSVRKRLDFSRPVEPELLNECLELAAQAPTGSNAQGWHFIVVTDPDKRAALCEMYRKGFEIFYGNREAAEANLPADDPEYVATGKFEASVAPFTYTQTTFGTLAYTKIWPA